MTEKARIGFIGCGRHATSSLYPAIRTIEEFNLVAVCARHEENARKTAETFGASSYYDNVDKMFEKEKLDGAVVVGPPDMQVELGKKCLDAGLPVFVEKPSAKTSGEALEFAEYAKSKGLWGMTAFMKRFSTSYRMAKHICESAEFGDISGLELRMANGRYPDLKEMWGFEGGAAYSFLVGQAVHVLDLARFFCGDVKEVYSSYNEVDMNAEGGVFVFSVSVKFQNGASGVLNLNSAQGPGFQMSEYLALSGRECFLDCKDMAELNYSPNKRTFPEFAKLEGRAQTIRWKPGFSEWLGSKAEGVVGFKGELRSFARALLGLEKPGADLFDCVKALRFADAIWESSQSGKVVAL